MKCNPWVGGGIGRRGFPMLGTGARGLTTLIKGIFRNNEQGFAYDPNDLNEAKLTWRRNLLTATDFRNGMIDVTYGGVGITATAFDGVAAGTGFAVPSGAFNPAYKIVTNTVAGTDYTFSFFVRMDDGGVPVIDNAGGDPTSDFSVIMSGYITISMQTRLIPYGNGLYRVIGTRAADGIGQYFGLVKSSNNSARTFKASGYQLEVGRVPSEYQPITDFNTEFNKQFPLHALFQDAAGTIPVTAAGQPVGLMLDKSKGLALGVELITQPLDFTNWTKTAAVTSFTANSFTTNTGGGVTLQLFGGSSSKAYRITMKGTSTTVGTLRNGGTGSIAATIPMGAFDIVMNTPTLASFGTALYIALGSAGTITVDSISIKELAGNHAYQTVSASRPVLGRHPVTGARNLIHYSELSSNWTSGIGGTGLLPVKSYGATAPDGSNTASSVLLDKGAGASVSDQSSIFFPFAYAGEASHTLTVWMKTTDGSNKKVLLDFNGVAADSGTVGLKTVTGVWQQFEIKLAATDTGRVPSLRLRGTFGTADSASLHVWHPQLEAGLSATPYQKTNTRLDISENGVADAYYLKFDGIDDFLTVAKDNLKFLHDGTGSSVFIRYTPLSSTYHTLMTSGFLASVSNVGYTLSQDDRSGSGAVLNIITNGNGTSHVANNVGATGITTKPRVVTTKNKVGTHIIRHNALQILNNPTETGIASTAQSSQDLRIGNSAAGFPLTGHIYSLIGISRLTNDAETLALEKAIAKQTGVTLNV